MLAWEEVPLPVGAFTRRCQPITAHVISFVSATYDVRVVTDSRDIVCINVHNRRRDASQTMFHEFTWPIAEKLWNRFAVCTYCFQASDVVLNIPVTTACVHCTGSVLITVSRVTQGFLCHIGVI